MQSWSQLKAALGATGRSFALSIAPPAASAQLT